MFEQKLAPICSVDDASAFAEALKDIELMGYTGSPYVAPEVRILNVDHIADLVMKSDAKNCLVWLLDNCADLSKYGLTGLAAERGALKCLQHLYSIHNRLDLSNSNGRTLLMGAVINKRDNVVDWLIDKVDVKVKDRNGHTALYHALDYGYQHGIDLLSEIDVTAAIKKQQELLDKALDAVKQAEDVVASVDRDTKKVLHNKKFQRALAEHVAGGPLPESVRDVKISALYTDKWHISLILDGVEYPNDLLGVDEESPLELRRFVRHFMKNSNHPDLMSWLKVSYCTGNQDY